MSESPRDSGQDGQKPHDEPKEGGERLVVRRRSKVKKSEALWLMSFSDMSLILMSFFILQLSYSNPDKRKYDNLSSAITESQTKKPVENLATIEKKLAQVVKEQKLDKAVQVTSSVDGLAIEFKDAILFEAGAATASASNAQVVDQVMAVIAKTPGDYKLIIEGHTDETPVGKGKSARFQSNWDLSAARGIALLDAFKARGVTEQRMAIAAYAHTRPKVATTGLKGEALKKARGANRRVVIRIE